MSKIRINELARELEVKPNVILELLPELGVIDKKTHSSSLDDDVALAIRQRVEGSTSIERGTGGRSGDETRSDANYDDHDDEHAEDGPAHATQSENSRESARAESEAPASASALEPVSGTGGPVASHPAPAATQSIPAASQQSGPATGTPVARPVHPLRPPLAGPGHQPVAVTPSIPIPPPAPRVVVSPPVAPATPSAPATPPAASQPVAPVTAPVATPVAAQPTPAAPSAPQAGVPLRPSSPGAPAQPGPQRPFSGPMPTRPVAPPLRPGQILSGPRQPMPPGEGGRPPAGIVVPGSGPSAAPSSPGAPRALPSIPTPRPPMRPAGPGQGQPGQHSGQQQHGGQQGGPHAGQPLRPPARPPLAGQPAARPVVPPRPDIVARLQQKPAASPGAPAAPRPGMPTARPASPVPGRPIYSGPVRPGQPLMRGPGGPGGPGGPRPGGPGAPGRGRPMHPTTPLRPEPATLPTDPGRRHATKPGARDGRRRDADPEEGRLRPVSRRQEHFEPPPIDREITVAEGVTVKELSEKLGVKANLIIKKLVERKIFATINQTLDVKMAEELARDFGASTNKVSYEEESRQELEMAEVSGDLEKRPPVVTIMGHVDHGKTSLLDAIRLSNVAAREAGGITQHIGAYHVEKNGRKIVFIDTPGHEAFTRMRARGAKVTDIVILVVAADDGVMPQTIEAIDHAKAAKVPIIVAINKIDKPDAQVDRIKQQLSDRGLLAEDWGGDTVMVPVSAKAKLNLDLLLEMILLVADIGDFKANPNMPASGTVLEAKLDRGRGPVATVLVRNGTLKVGDHFICGSVFGRVRAMFDDRGGPVREVGPSMPAEVLGLESLPDVGDSLQVVTDTAKAKQIVIYREVKAREVAMAKNSRITLDQFHDQLREGEVKELNVIIKCDVGGTAEVLSDTLQKLSNDKVRIRVLHAGVGAITESDVLLASTSEAIIVGFNVKPERTAQALAEQEKIDIRLHSIIYELADEMKRAMTGLLDPVFKEVYKGRAQVRETFRITKVGTVAGCYVDDGTIHRSNEVRLVRDGKVVHTGRIDALKRFKNDASEVKQGFECGISLMNYNDIKAGDTIEAYVMERVANEAFV